MAERRFRRDLATPLVVAHRGASAERPENTLAAFERALDAGSDAVEFDVRMSADDHPVVVHDASVDRTTDGTGLVRDLSLVEIKRLHIRSASGEDADVPTLAETLAVLSGRAAIDVEIKNLPGEPDHEPERERAVEATLSALHETAFVGAVLISSFNPRSIARSRDIEPAVPTGLLALEAMPLDDAVALAVAGGHEWMLPAANAVLAAGRELIDRAHDVELRLGTWIVDDADVAVTLASWGIDAVATNDPGRVVPAVRAVAPR